MGIDPLPPTGLLFAFASLIKIIYMTPCHLLSFAQ